MRKAAVRVVGLLMVMVAFSSCTIAPVLVQEAEPEFRYPTESFVKMTMYLDGDQVSSGSGSVIDQRDEYAVVLTAAHVCSSERLEAMATQLGVDAEVRAHGQVAEVIDLDRRNDICLMRVNNGLEGRPALSLADSVPRPQQTYYTVSSPLGISSPSTGLVGIFEGKYLGIRSFRSGEGTVMRAIYAIPSAGGSSGAPIMDAEGGVVSITTHGYPGFHHATIGPNWVAFYVFVTGVLDRLDVMDEPRS